MSELLVQCDKDPIDHSIVTNKIRILLESDNSSFLFSGELNHIGHFKPKILNMGRIKKFFYNAFIKHDNMFYVKYNLGDPRVSTKPLLLMHLDSGVVYKAYTTGYLKNNSKNFAVDVAKQNIILGANYTENGERVKYRNAHGSIIVEPLSKFKELILPEEYTWT